MSSQDKEPVKKEIFLTRESFFAQLSEQEELALTKISQIVDRLTQIRNLRFMALEKESLGFRVRYFDTGKALTFEAKEKESMGFKNG